MVGEGLVAPFGLERGHREEEAQLERREVPGHSQRWMVPTGKQKEGNSAWHNSDWVGLAWGFFVRNVLQTPLNTRSGSLLRFVSNNICFCTSASKQNGLGSAIPTWEW